VVGLVKGGLTDTEAVKYITPIRHASPRLKTAGTPDSCTPAAVAPPVAGGTRSEVSTRSTVVALDRFLVYVSYVGEADQNRKLKQYREFLLSEVFRLSAPMSVARIFKQEHKDRDLFDKLTAEYLDGDGDSDTVKALLRKEKQTLIDGNLSTLYVYLIRLKDLHEQGIKATPLLLELNFDASKNEVTVTSKKELGAKIQLLTEFAPSAKEHAVALLTQLAELKPDRFSDPIVFVDCVDDTRLLNIRIDWKVWAAKELARKLEAEWTASANKDFHSYNGRVRHASECPDRGADLDPDNRRGNPSTRESPLANERVLPIILRSSTGAAGGLYKADWRKLRMARQPVPGLAKDCGPSTDNPIPFVNTW